MTNKSKTPQRQLVFVIDLNKCIGCQTCTVACKKLWTAGPGQDFMYWRNVETTPGKGYPMHWKSKGGGYKNGALQMGDFPAPDQYGVPFDFDFSGRLFEGKKDRVKPSPAPRSAPNWDEDQGADDYPNNFFFYLPRMCNHCAKPACLEACPEDAIYKREQDGLVVINQDYCLSKKSCIKACPYAKSYYNSVTGTANKCIGCFPRVEKGVEPVCVAQCVGRAMHVGFIDDEASSVHKLVKLWKVAMPLYPEFGTEPNVFYVPPILGSNREDNDGEISGKPRIPFEHLIGLFGSGVVITHDLLNAERNRKIAGQESEIMDILIGRRSADMMSLSIT